MIFISPARVRCKRVNELSQRTSRETNGAGKTNLDGLLSERLAVDPPLRSKDGLDDVSRLAADGDSHGVVLGLDVVSTLGQELDDLDSGVESLHALEVLSGVSVERTVVVKDVDELEVVSSSALVIVLVVRRRDLDGSGSKGHVDGDGVGDDGDASLRKEGVDDELAVEVLVPLVVGVDGNGRVSKHGLGSGGGDDDLLVRALDLVREGGDGSELELLLQVVAGNVEERSAGELLLVDLEVRQRRVHGDTPVAESVFSVDESILEELAEGLVDSDGMFLRAGARRGLSGVMTRIKASVQRRTSLSVKAVRLQSYEAPSRRSWFEIFSWYLQIENCYSKRQRASVFDHRTGQNSLVLPLPNPVQELLPTEIVLGDLLRLPQSLLDDGLGGDTGVVVSGSVKDGVALHSVPGVARTTSSVSIPPQPERRGRATYHRMRQSWIATVKACPMWRAPVTLGGGMGITKVPFGLTDPLASNLGLNMSSFSHQSYQAVSTARGL